MKNSVRLYAYRFPVLLFVTLICSPMILAQKGSRIVNLEEQDASGTKNDKVSIFVLSNQGPLGELYYPNEIGDKLGDSFKPAEIESDFIYPSLYFDISATPKFGDGNAVINKDFDLKWMDVEISLDKECSEDKVGSKDNKHCSLWLLDMFPNETKGKTKDNPLVNVVGIAEELAKLTNPFFLSGTGKILNAKIGAGTNGLSVLFSNLLPPIVKTYFHPRIVGGRQFGWTFRQDKDAEQPSLLGLQRGIVFLQAGKNVTKIKVTYKIKSLWNKKVDEKGKYAEFTRTYKLELPDLKQPTPIDYTKIQTLSDFPALIKMEEVCKIFSIDQARCLKKTTFDSLKINLQNGDPNLTVSFPMQIANDTEASGTLFKRSEIQKYLNIDKK
jgi:hypothetical protein